MTGARSIDRRAWACLASAVVAFVALWLIHLFNGDQIDGRLGPYVGFLFFVALGSAWFFYLWTRALRRRGRCSPRDGMLAGWSVAGMTLSAFVAFLLTIPAYSLVQRAELHREARSHFKQVAAAILAYHDEHKSLPPVAIRSADGRPLLSWRVVILPYLGNDALYRQFRLDEPWDSPNNFPLLQQMPPVFAIPFGQGKPYNQAFIQTVVGPGTAFERDGLSVDRDFPDGLAQTVLIIESSEAVPWTKPDDIAFDPAEPEPRVGARPPSSSVRNGLKLGHCYYAACDGTVELFYARRPPFPVKSFLTRNGGEDLSYWR